MMLSSVAYPISREKGDKRFFRTFSFMVGWASKTIRIYSAQKSFPKIRRPPHTFFVDVRQMT